VDKNLFINIYPQEFNSYLKLYTAIPTPSLEMWINGINNYKYYSYLFFNNYAKTRKPRFYALFRYLLLTKKHQSYPHINKLIHRLKKIKFFL
jgi:hypothetical protein